MHDMYNGGYDSNLSEVWHLFRYNTCIQFQKGRVPRLAKSKY